MSDDPRDHYQDDFDDECWNCGGVGRVNDCIDGCCVDQDDPWCEYCSKRCDICNAKPKVVDTGKECTSTTRPHTGIANELKTGDLRMEAKFTNGSTVNRIWSDGKSTELIAAFQYENDAISFAEARVAEDQENNFGPCRYAIHCTYSGKLTMVGPVAPAKQKAA